MAHFATPEATKAYADRMWAENPKISPDSWRMLEGLTVAKVSMGTYRMDGRDAQPEALKTALLSGLNLVDTAANYMDGAAEVFVGQTLKELFKTQKLQREEVVLVGKAGYIQGQALGARKQTPPPETVFCSETLWHCMHPDFLHQEYEQSCRRLGVEGLDVYMLHNPEHFLQQAAANNTPLKEAQTAFYKRLEKAFTFFETLCQQEKLQCYGLSSHMLVLSPQAPGFIDLAQVHEVAQKAAQKAWGRRKRPLFRVVQMPYNLVETHAVSTPNTTAKTFNGTENVTTLELATRMHLAVLANRPLNAFDAMGTPYRLADGFKTPLDLSAAIQALQKIEAKLAMQTQLPRLGQMAQGFASQLENSLHFDHLKTTALTPLLLETLAENKTLTQADLEAFMAAYEKVVQALRHAVATKDSQKVCPLRTAFYGRLPKGLHNVPFQQVAINTIASTPGVTTVLAGLRHPSYVADGLRVLQQGDVADIGTVLSA